MNSIRKLSNAIGLTAAEVTIHKSIGDVLTAALITESVQPWHTVGMIVSCTGNVLNFLDVVKRMATVTLIRLEENVYYVAAEVATGDEPVTNMDIADMQYHCLAAGTGYITLTQVKPILRTEAGPVVLPEVHEDAEFVIDADVPVDPPVYGAVRIKVVIS